MHRGGMTPFSCMVFYFIWMFLSANAFKINVDLKIGRVFQLVIYHDKSINIFQ